MTDKKTHREIIEPRTLIFKRNSKYKAYKKGSEQQSAMGHFERRWDTSLYYMFYNPFVILHSINMPVIEHLDFVDNEVGCRVMPKIYLDRVLSDKNDGYSPSYGDLADRVNGDIYTGIAPAGWRLEEFATDLMLECKEGMIDESPNFETMLALANQKQNPISSSISITFDIP